MTKKRAQLSDEQLFPSLKGQGGIALDCETKDEDIKTQGCGAHRRDCFIAGIALGTEAGHRQYYPIAHESGQNMDREKVLRYVRHELSRPEQPKIGANLLYDHQFLTVAKVEIKGPLHDVQIAEPLLCETRFNYNLEALSQDYLGIGKIDEELEAYILEKFGKVKNPKGYIWRCPPEIVTPYAIGDVNHPIEIFKTQRAQLEKENLWSLFEMESRLIPLLSAMRLRGVRVDVARTEQVLEEMRTKYKEYLREIRRVTGVEVNPWSAASIAEAFDGMGISYPMTKGSEKRKPQPSFTAPWLENHPAPVAGMIREARRMDKMCGTFLEGSILNRHIDGRIHCNFNQLKGEDGGAVSGRFSSSMPNLQFIPVRTEEGKRIRSLFIPERGGLWYKKDYSQIEYRLLVHDATVLKLRGAAEVAEKYRTDPKTDFHEVVAEMTGLERGPAKTINFGIAYGEGKDKLARQLGLSIEAAMALLRGYHQKAPFMKPLSEGCMGMAARDGVIVTLLGRKRRFDMWGIRDRRTGENKVFRTRVPGSRRAFTHKALNARTQGSAADIMKKAMVDVMDSGVIDVLGVPQLTVHDELDGSYENNKIGREALREMSNIMERTVTLRVPLKVDGSTGKNWGAAK